MLSAVYTESIDSAACEKMEKIELSDFFMMKVNLLLVHVEWEQTAI